MAKKNDNISEKVRKSNRERSRRNKEKLKILLGQSIDTAWYRLRKKILFDFVQKSNKDICYRCGEKITDIDDFSIEHKIQWAKSENPRENFFDLENIAYSHEICNYRNDGKGRFNVRPDAQRRGVTEIKGRRKKWRASIKKDRKSITIGYFETEDEAKKAYDRKAIEFWGDQAVTNKSLGFLDN